MMIWIARATLVATGTACACWLMCAVIRHATLLSFVLPVVGLVVTVAAFRLPIARQADLALVILSSMLAAYLAEGTQRLLTKRATRVAVAARAGIRFDDRSPLEVLLQMRKQGQEVMWSRRHEVVQQLSKPGEMALLRRRPSDAAPDAFLPLGGVSNVNTLLCNESGRYALYQADEHGFRNPPGLWNAPHLDLALLGDSFVQGFCVDSDQDIAAHLRARYPGTLNLGYGGNGPLANLATFREYVEPLKPDVVAWFHYEGNDVSDLNEEKTHPEFLAYLKEGFSQHLLARQGEIDTLYRSVMTDETLEDAFRSQHDARHPGRAMDSSIMRWVRFLRLDALRERLQSWLNRPPDPVPELDEPLFADVLRAVRASVASWGGRFYVVYLPEWRRYRQRGYRDPHRDRVMAMLARLRIPVVDIHPVFVRHGDPLSLFPLRLYGHYTPEGYGVVADALMQAAAPHPSSARTSAFSK